MSSSLPAINPFYHRVKASWEELSVENRAKKQQLGSEQDKSFIQTLNKTLGNKVIKANAREEEENINFNFRDQGLLGNRIDISELEKLNPSDIKKLKTLLNSTNIDTLVSNLSSNNPKDKAEANELTELIFKFAIDLKRDEIDIVENLHFGTESAEVTKNLEKIIEECRKKSNEIIERKALKLNLSDEQKALREKVLEFFKFSDNHKLSETERTEARLNILKEILMKAESTDDLKTFNRIDLRPNGQVIYEAKLFREINNILGGDHLAAKLTENIVNAFHDVTNHSEKNLYQHAYEEHNRNVNNTLIELQKNIFDKVKQEKFSSLSLVDLDPNTRPANISPDDWAQTQYQTKLNEVLESVNQTDKLKAYNELKISLIRDILFPDLSDKKADDLQTNAIKRFIDFENQIRGEIDKRSRMASSTELIIDAVNGLNSNKDLINNFYPVRLDTLIEGSEMLVKDDLKEKILAAYGVSNLNDLTAEQRKGYIDICLNDIKDNQRTEFKENLIKFKNDNDNFTKQMGKVLELSQQEIFAANAYGNRELNFLSNLEANIDRFMYSYDSHESSKEASMNEDAAKFLGSLAINDLLLNNTEITAIQQRVTVLEARSDAEKEKVQKMLFGDNDEAVRSRFIENIPNLFEEIKNNPNLKTDDGRSIDAVFSEFTKREGFKTLNKDIATYLALNDKNTREAFFLEMNLTEKFLHEYYHLITEFDHKGTDARDVMPTQVKELIQRKTGIDVNAEAEYSDSVKLFDELLVDTKQSLVRGVSSLFDKFLEFSDELEKRKTLAEKNNFNPYKLPDLKHLDKFFNDVNKNFRHPNGELSISDYLSLIVERLVENLIGERLVPLETNKAVNKFEEDSPLLKLLDLSIGNIITGNLN